MSRKLKITNKVVLQRKINQYFDNLKDKDGKWTGKATFTGLALACGFSSRAQMVQYKKREEFREMLERAELRVENYYEDQLLKNAGQVAGAIFGLKNNFGWQDKREIERIGGPEVIVFDVADKARLEAKKIRAKRKRLEAAKVLNMEKTKSGAFKVKVK